MQEVKLCSLYHSQRICWLQYEKEEIETKIEVNFYEIHVVDQLFTFGKNQMILSLVVFMASKEFQILSNWPNEI